MLLLIPFVGGSGSSTWLTSRLTILSHIVSFMSFALPSCSRKLSTSDSSSETLDLRDAESRSPFLIAANG
jgi:hypothetical protein